MIFTQRTITPRDYTPARRRNLARRAAMTNWPVPSAWDAEYRTLADLRAGQGVAAESISRESP
jgi:hypothetical protein